MTRMSREKGYRAENDVARWLRTHGFPHAERRSSGTAGADIAELGPGLELEIKNTARFEPAAWVDQLLDAMHANDSTMGAVIAKRKGKTDVGEWYGILPVDLLVRLLRDAGWGDPRTDHENGDTP